MLTNIAISGISQCNSVLFVTTDILNPPVLLLKKHIAQRKGIDGYGYYLVQDGRVLADNDEVDTQNNSMASVSAIPRLLGGKGGFGSLIRAMGKSTQKSQNTEACRDLSGRRMRDVSTEKKLAQWIKDSAEKKKEAEKEKKVRREQRRAGPKHIFNDQEYMSQMQANTDNINDALKQGLAACSSSSGTSGIKRQCAASEPSAAKKLHLWSGMDDLSDEELSDDEETEENGTANSSDKSKRIISSSIPQPKKTDSDSSENGADDEPREDSTVVNKDQGVVESSSITPPVETENVAPENIESDKNKSSDVAEGKYVTSEDDKTDATLPPSSQNSTNSTENGNSNGDKETVEKLKPEEITFEPIDLEKYTTAEELISAVTPDHLKFTLQQLGLKCGGTPAQRGERLFATKGKSLSELDPSMFAKPKTQKKR